jgi:hypothetical protein
MRKDSGQPQSQGYDVTPGTPDPQPAATVRQRSSGIPLPSVHIRTGSRVHTHQHPPPPPNIAIRTRDTCDAARLNIPNTRAVPGFMVLQIPEHGSRH